MVVDGPAVVGVVGGTSTRPRRWALRSAQRSVRMRGAREAGTMIANIPSGQTSKVSKGAFIVR